jgi:hypothetical protein
MHWNSVAQLNAEYNQANNHADEAEIACKQVILGIDSASLLFHPSSVQKAENHSIEDFTKNGTNNDTKELNANLFWAKFRASPK